MKNFFEWVRFWGKAGTEPDLDPDGFLVGPDAELGTFYDPGIRSLADSSLKDIPCLILVGSGGEGKTTEVRRLLAPGGNPLKSSDPPDYINLGQISSVDKLDRKLKAWSSAPSRPKLGNLLVLDGLDECWDTMPDLIRELPDFLGNLGAAEPKVRIASRPGPWIQQLEASVRLLWPGKPDSVQTYHLLPLTRDDVKLAAARCGIGEPGAFLRQIVSNGLAGFAAKPLGLRFLIESYLRTGSLGENRYKLYFDGCLALATEHDRQRREDKRHDYLEPNQRLAAAARIGAITAFGGRHIVTDPDSPLPVRDGDLAIADLAGGSESVKGVDFSVTESAVREVVRHTNLFDPAAADGFAWAHRTFEEFLAAHWLCEHGFSTRQLANLLTTTVTGSRKVYPNLVGVAGWVAARQYGFFDLVARSDPEALIESDAGIGDDERREQLAALVLKRIESRPALDPGWEWYRRYSKLRHPRMAEQIRGVLLAAGSPAEVRRAAIRMARACRVVELAEDLLRIALAPESDRLIRVTAAAGVADLGDRENRLKLRALLDLPASEDPDDALRGIALSAMRQAGLPASEILPHLRRPRQENVLGHYWFFLAREFPPSLAAGEIGPALVWLDENAASFEALQLDRIAGEFAEAAWRHLAAVGEDVRQHLASLLLRIDDGGYRIAGPVRTRLERLAKDATEPRRLLLETVAAVGGRAEAPDGMVPGLSGFAGIARTESVAWLIERALAAPAGARRGWLSLIWLAADVNDPRQRKALIDASSCIPALKQLYGRLLAPGGWEAFARQRASEASPRPAWDGVPNDLVANLAKKVADGQWDAWLLLNRQLWREPDFGGLQWPTGVVCTAPGWHALSAEIQDLIGTACDAYVRGALPALDDWIGGTSIPEHAAIDYWTLRWAVQRNARLLAALPPESLGAWAALAPAFWGPGLIGEEGECGHLDLVDRFMEAAPASFIQAALDRMRVQAGAHGYVNAHEQLQRHYRDRAGPALLGFVADRDTDESPLETVASALVEAGYEPARELLLQFLRHHEPGASDERVQERAVSAAHILLDQSPDVWPEVRALLEHDPDFGEGLADRWHSFSDLGTPRGLGRLGEEDLADLFLLLEARGIHKLRGTILGLLKGRRTRASHGATERLRNTFPDLPWLDLHVLGAERYTVAGDWTPVPPEDLLAMARNRQNYVVRSESDLFEIVLEALERFGKDLRGKRRLVRHLWNENPPRPKTEATLSDEVSDYLRQTLCEQGAIVNREVQIRPHPKGTGDRTDVLVSATKKGPGGAAEVANVVIELKGCWDDALWTAMETQLVTKYLRGSEHHHGIYLVGWYSASDWGDGDSRKRKCERTDMSNARSRLEAQATALSKDGITVQALVLDATYDLG